MKWAVDVEAKAAWQTLLLVRKNNAPCLHNLKLLNNKESRDWKDFKVKKNYLTTNNNNRNRNGDQSSQVLGQSSKKDSCLNKGGQ